MSPAVCASRHEHLLLPHRAAAESTIMIYLTAPGLAVMPMRVMASDSIAAVKLRVQTAKGDQIRLTLEGEELDDRHLIHDVCRTDGAVIHLLVHSLAALQVPPLPATKATGIIEPVVVNSEALQDLIAAVLAGTEKGNAPVMSSEGTGGAYLMQDASGTTRAVFKPVDEEPMAVNNPRGLPVSSTGEGLKKGTRVGEGAFREVAAYLLDQPLIHGRRRSSSFVAEGHFGFAGVPPTALVRCMHTSFRQPEGEGAPPVLKLGSMQAFVKNCGTCEDMGPRAFPVQEVHKISVLDMRLANADRHAGNILVCKDDQGIVSLVPIDHGYCLPESFEDCTFEWLYWPQSREPFDPFDEETAEYIGSLDAEEDIAILKFHGWEISSQCARTLRVTTMLLKKGVERGLTACDIGSFMCRETLTKESTIEEMVREAQK